MDRTIARMITLLARKNLSYIGSTLSKKYNLTAAEQPFFMTLQHQEGMTQEELTAIVCVDKAATARAVKSLEEKGYLIRVQDRNDRRQNRIYPTDTAKQLAPAVKSELLRFNALLTQGIAPAELDTAYTVLQKMEENLSRLSGSGSLTSTQEVQNNGTDK